ncbi:glycosyltransferase family 4 protein [Candidatus Kaiserbacteria bacterium]|nr:glycosyltransferase family 4 protein [Candidatus Kaiserbacteria bacterium]
MKVLTFGWDFPPTRNGGLGVACFGLTRELTQEGVDVIFVLPKRQRTEGTPRFVFADDERRVKIREVSSALSPYKNADSLVSSIVGYDKEGRPIYKSRSIIEEAHRFAHAASLIAQEEDFDLIHAHDWTSYLAGVAAKIVSGKPLVLHVHATSFDQAASDNVDPAVYKIEKEAFAVADKVVTVSEFTKDIVVKKHNVPEEKVEVIHNGCDVFEPPRHETALRELKEQGKKIVLYHGRITIQKGVDYFIRAARRVVDIDPNVVFVISGWGDMTNQIIEQVGAMGLSKNVIFAGALWEEERDRMYQSADLVVMPSVSEPFGLVPLEAMQHGTPSLISKQSGVKEVMTHVLKVDFWDVDEMANQILSTLRYDVMRRQLANEGKMELKKLSWRQAAERVYKLYRNLLQYVTN